MWRFGWLMEEILSATEDTCLEMQTHRITLTLAAQVQPYIVLQILLTELFQFLLLNLLCIELAHGFVFLRLRILHLVLS